MTTKRQKELGILARELSKTEGTIECLEDEAHHEDPNDTHYYAILDELDSARSYLKQLHKHLDRLGRN
jgi:hypothetical protein